MQKTHVLTQVPEHVIDAPKQIAANQRWNKRFNVACWVRFDAHDDSSVTLNLRFRDSSGVKEVTVEQTRVNSKTLLLSGVATLKIVGRLERLDVIMQSDLNDYRVDELFVLPVKEQSAVRARPARRAMWGATE